MSSIHYKFRATLEYKTLQFDGLSILGGDLKREICSKESIKAEAFDLILQNAHTKRQYNNDEQIPRNSSIIVQRVPKEDGEKLPKIQGVNMGMVTRGEASVDSGINVTGHIVQSQFDKMTEEERLAHIKDVSTAKFQSSNFQKRATGPLMGPPPPTYTCNRCHQPGHWFKNCPLLNQKRTTGIPSQELMETTADDPMAMLHPSGKHVIPIMHWRARQHKKTMEETPERTERVVPPEFTCPICGHLLKDAVLTACCGNSFCAECVSQRLLESEEQRCPGDKCTQKVAVDSLIPNKMVRQAVQAWQASGTPAEAQAQERVRIGILPSSNVPSTSSANALAAVGVTTVITTTTPSVAVPTPPPVSSAPTVLTAPGTSLIPPSVPSTLPTNFSQPPPNMMANSLAPPGTTPMMPTAIPPLIPPPIPGIGMMAPLYGSGRPTLNINTGGPQFINAWEAFLKRNDRSSGRDQDRNRDRKRRKRSRDRRSRSRTPSDDDRKRMRNARGGGARGSTRAAIRSKDNNHSSRDHHDSRDGGRTKPRRHEESSEEKSRRRKEKDYEERKKKKRRTASPKDEPMDEEAAIDDALKEVEELNKMLPDSEDAVDVDVDLDAPATSDVDKDVKLKKEEAMEEDVNDKASSEDNRSPDVRKSPVESEEKVKKDDTEAESADEKARVRSSDSGTTHEEKTDLDEEKDEKKHKKHKHKRDRDGSESPRKEKKNKKHKKEKKHKKHREDETEEERKERKRLKKEKKEKKRREEEEEKPKPRGDEKERKKSSDDEKHHHRRHKDEKEEKKHREEKDEKRSHKEDRRDKDERKEDRKRHDEDKDRRREKEGHHRSKEEKEDRHRDEKSKEDRHREERHKEEKQERHREDKGKDERHKEQKGSEACKSSGDSKKLSKLERLSESKTKDSSGKPPVVDEKRIREHFSPPPTLLQHKKITLNI